MLSLPFIGVGHRERTAVFMSIMPKKRPTIMADLILSSGELIPLQDNNGKKAVSARDLYNFLGCTERFQSWFDRQLQYGFSDGVDFTSVKTFTVVNNGAEKPLEDYAMTINMAKEVSMIQRSEKGKLARRYFIACEEKLKEVMSPSYMISDPIKRAEKWIEEEKVRQQLALDNKIMKPKADYFDALVDRNMLTNLRDTAKQIHLTQNKFISLLLENKFVYRDSKNKLKPYAEYTPLYFEMKDFNKNGHAGTQLLVNPKSKETFRLMWGGSQYDN